MYPCPPPFRDDEMAFSGGGSGVFPQEAGQGLTLEGEARSRGMEQSGREFQDEERHKQKCRGGRACLCRVQGSPARREAGGEVEGSYLEFLGLSKLG